MSADRKVAVEVSHLSSYCRIDGQTVPVYSEATCMNCFVTQKAAITYRRDCFGILVGSVYFKPCTCTGKLNEAT